MEEVGHAFRISLWIKSSIKWKVCKPDWDKTGYYLGQNTLSTRIYLGKNIRIETVDIRGDVGLTGGSKS